MKKISVLAVAFFTCLTFLSAKDNLAKDIANGAYENKKPTQIYTFRSGESYAQLSADGKKITKYSFKTGKQEQILFDASATKGKKVNHIEGFIVDQREKKMLIYNNSEKVGAKSFVADYYVFDIDRNRLDALSDSIGKQRDPVFSPDGQNVVFGRGNDLFLKKLAYETESPVSKAIYNKTFVNGITDPLYETAFDATNLIAWSPDSRQVAYVGLDETDVALEIIQLFGKEPYTKTTLFKYPKAGTANPKPVVYIFDAYYKSTKKVDLPEEDFYIPRIKWTNDAENVAIFTLDRNQRQMKMYSVNCKSMIAKVILSETSEDYFDYKNLDFVQFLNDGKFTFANKKDGFRQLFLHNANGLLNKQLTTGKYDVCKFYGYDSIKKLVYYQAAAISPTGREIYSVDLKGGKPTLLSENKGVSHAEFGSQYSYFIKKYSTANAPSVYSICNTSGKEISILEKNEELARKASSLAKKEFTTINNLSAYILKPSDFSETKKYPVILLQGCVSDCFKVGIEQLFVSNGFIVVCINSQSFIQTSSDLIAVSKHIGSLNYVDKNKIGIYADNYNTSAALQSMSTGETIFAAGVVIAPVTDFKLFSSANIERYLKRPQESAAAYDNSPVNLTEKMNGKLLLIHGTADKEVLVQQTYNYANALIEAGKQFDMQIYPDQGHNFDAKTCAHMYQHIVDFFAQSLK